jgi:hypothetical protein
MIPNLPLLEKNIVAAHEPASTYRDQPYKAEPDKPQLMRQTPDIDDGKFWILCLILRLSRRTESRIMPLSRRN